MRYKAYKLSKETQLKNVSVMNYALEISGFPQILMDEKVLQEHFEYILQKPNCIVEVSFARHYQNMLRNQRQLAELQKQFHILKIKLKRKVYSLYDNENEYLSVGRKIVQFQNDLFAKQFSISNNMQCVNSNSFISALDQRFTNLKSICSLQYN